MTYTPLTLQQVFDTALQTMRARDYVAAATTVTGCLYRSPIGPCAIGASIPDELYDPIIEQSSVGDLIKGDPYALVWFENEEDAEPCEREKALMRGIAQLFSDCPRAALASMQVAHDTMRGAAYESSESRRVAFEGAMAGIAAHYGLTYTPPQVDM